MKPFPRLGVVERGLFFVLSLLVLSARPVAAALDLFPPAPAWGAGTDGAFAPTSNVVIDLSQAPVASWNTDSTGDAGKGVYDATQWAVVFKYTSVTIPQNVTVTFKNRTGDPPVVWLVSGDVSIAGTLSVSGSNGDNAFGYAEPGPGGFRGGATKAANGNGSDGFGPGGGFRISMTGCSGNYASPNDADRGVAYGNDQILPLIGGSGGANSYNSSVVASPGAGGGAILIAATGTISVTGSLNAVGGASNHVWSGGGSGGAIRLIADRITGGGNLRASGSAFDGRVRLESPQIGGFGNITGSTSMGDPNAPYPWIWPPDTLPTVKITSVGDAAVSATPLGGFESATVDATIMYVIPQVIRLEATNVPLDWQVIVRMVPKRGEQVIVDATRVSGDANSSTWEATTTFPFGISALQARAYKP